MNQAPEVVGKQQLFVIACISSLVFAIEHFFTLERYSSSITQGIVGAITIIVITLIATKRQSWLFPMLISSIPFEVLSITSQTSPFQLRPYQYITVISLLAIFGKPESRKRVMTVIRESSHIFIAIGILLGLHLLGIRVTSPIIIVKYEIIMAIFAGIFFVTRYHLRYTTNAETAIQLLLLSAVSPVTIATLQNASHIHHLNIVQGEWTGRPKGTFVESTWLGMFLGSLGAWLAYFTLKARHVRWYRIIGILGFFAAVVSVLARSSWLGTGIALTLTTFVTLFFSQEIPRKQWALRTATLLLLNLCAVLLVVFVPLTEFNLRDRLQSIVNIKPSFESTFYQKEEEITTEEISIKSRLETLKENISLFKEHPIIGTGFGSIEERRRLHDNESSLPFQLLISTGIIGLIVFAFALLETLWKLLRTTTSSLLVATTGITLIVLLFMNLIDAGLLIALLWIELGIITSIAAQYKKKQTI